MSFVRRWDMSTFFDDLRHTQPTFISLVPRISSMIYEAYRIKLTEIASVSRDPLRSMRACRWEGLGGLTLLVLASR
jgi:long-subunit acyl-CoA synthetase (AMP-forming)